MSDVVIYQSGTFHGGIHHYPESNRSVPRQLLGVPRHFVGRVTELAHLTASLDNAGHPGGTVLISALTGVSGIGKTTLALHWAHQNLHRFPDGQLFVDLQGFSAVDEPLDPARAVRGFLEALGVPVDRISPDLPAMAARYRSEVAGKRLLVVLDNANAQARWFRCYQAAPRAQ